MLEHITVCVTLALPAYNEQDNIQEVIERSIAALDQLGRTWELLVIDNHSSDNTAQVVRECMGREPRLRLVVHETNRLYSGSCNTALREARGEYIAIMDSDGQFVATDLSRFLDKLMAGANFVLGWRRERHDPRGRLIASAIFNGMGRFYLGCRLHDLNCGIRMFDRKFQAVGQLQHHLNLANPEFYVRARLAGLKLDEVEIRHFERNAGQSCHSLLKSWHIFVKTWRYCRALRQELREGVCADAQIAAPPASISEMRGGRAA